MDSSGPGLINTVSFVRWSGRRGWNSRKTAQYFPLRDNPGTFIPTQASKEPKWNELPEIRPSNRNADASRTVKSSMVKEINFSEPRRRRGSLGTNKATISF